MAKVRSSKLSGLVRSGLAGALLSGCWLQVGHDAGHTNANAGETTLTAVNVATLGEVWSTDLATEASEPMVRGGSVYLTSAGTDAVSGESAVTVSAFRLADGPAVAPPAISDGQVFVADTTRVMAFPTAGCGAATCDPTWTFEMGSAVSTVVAAPGGDDVFTIRNNNLLVALSRVDGATGRRRWAAPPRGSLSPTAGSTWPGARRSAASG